jgi:uncharacterized damage-inducible protein DinB
MSVFSNPASSAPEAAQQYVAAVLNLLADRDPMAVLAETASSLRRTLTGLSPDAVRRPEAPGKWSIGEVLAHLADSELVWGYRLRMVLAQERPALAGYDQDLWAERFRYRESDPAEAIERFAVLRRANLRLLERASAADLQRVAVHAERGEESVAHMVRLYAGHDVLHLSQIERIGSRTP